MSYKTLLVSLNEIERLDALLAIAGALARDHEAHILGLYVIPAPAVYPAVGPYVVPEVFDGLTRYFEEQAKGTRERFDAEMRKNGLSAEWLEWKSAAPAIAETVCDAGHSADLLLVSETNRDGKNGVELDFVENLVLGCGRPVIVVPRKATGGLEARQVVCGYNGSKESARAIHDAIPILRRADDVRLIWVDPAKDGVAADEVPGADMAVALGRHGVRATAEPMPTNGLNPAEALMMRARDLGAGLVVMGAYGHSRIREFVLGGATGYALNCMTVPIFMAH
ncbi:MAG TPA: universal stress protein [Aestuariivirgaceae bacterium]|nr:universal stress protein [Aestuariivirgaceae bacterium]